MAGLDPETTGRLGDVFANAERRRRRAAEAEQAAYDRWQRAYAAHEVASDKASAAWQAFAAAVTH